MQYVEYPLWMVKQALSVLSYFWPVTLVLAVPFFATLVLKSPFVGSRARFSRRHLSVFLPLAVTLLILIWGTVMQHPNGSQNLAPNWPVYVLRGLLMIQLVASIWVVWLMKGYRLFSVFTVGLELWFSLGCAFIAGMSVTGNWL